MKDRFKTWLIENKSDITKPEKYTSTIITISNHFKKSIGKDINLYDFTDPNDVLSLKEEYFSYDKFFNQNDKGNSMYSRSFDLYIEFLISNQKIFSNIENEVKDIQEDTSLTSLEKERIILSRIGQGKFRDELIKLWQGCTISKFKDTRFLIASHIMPWRISNNKEKIDKYNGLLLLPTYDKLFDLGFISFEDDGKIKISRFIKDTKSLNIDSSIVIDIKDGNKKYLKYHRENIWKK